jgi:hypothetical protein
MYNNSNSTAVAGGCLENGRRATMPLVPDRAATMSLSQRLKISHQSPERPELMTLMIEMATELDVAFPYA